MEDQRPFAHNICYVQMLHQLWIIVWFSCYSSIGGVTNRG